MAFLPLVARLPDELLLLLFEFMTYSTAEHTSPILLAGVCRKWRSVIYASPSVWTSLAFGTIGNEKEIQPESAQSYRRILSDCRQVKQQLQKSGHATLGCRVDFWESEATYQDPYIEGAIRELFSSLYRCQYLELGGYIPNRDSMIPRPTPILNHMRTLVLRHDNTWLEDVPFPRTPALRHLTIADMGIDIPFPSNYHSIRTLELRGCAAIAPVIIDILCDLQQLEEFAITPLTPSRRAGILAPLPKRTARLTHLRELDFDFTVHLSSLFHQTARNVLQNIRAPRLRTVRLRNVKAEDLRALRDLITASGPPTITSLAITNPESNNDCIIRAVELISHLSSLETLLFSTEAHRHTDHNRLLHALQWPAENTGLTPSPDQPSPELRRLGICPQLRRIAIHNGRADETCLQEMICSRVAGYAGPAAHAEDAPVKLVQVDLEGLEFCDDPPRTGSRLDWLDVMKKQGHVGGAYTVWPSLDL